MGKTFKMPAAKDFFKLKRICWRKNKPIWIILEEEMQQKITQKPYNQKVGDWLKFLHDMRYYFYCEGKRVRKILDREMGPAWYCEFSSGQKEILDHLGEYLHQDAIEQLPRRTRKALQDLGFTLNVSNSVLTDIIQVSWEDPGLFMWHLYKKIYQMPPYDLRKSYDLNAKLLMSSLVFIDLDECMARLRNIVKLAPKPPFPPKKKPPKYYEPKVRFGEYLQKMYIPFYSNHLSKEERKFLKIRNTPILDCKIKLRSAASYERIAKTEAFIEKRIERNQKEKAISRVCTYKFWEPPSTLRNSDPKMVNYVLKLKMFKIKAHARHNKHKAPFENIQFHVGTISYSGEKPIYMLQNMITLPTGYMPLNAGVIKVGTEYITHIQGFWKYPRSVDSKCDETCDCLIKWERGVVEYLKRSKCECGHFYDYDLEKKPVDKFFYRPTRYLPFYFDQAITYQMDPKEDFIKDTLAEALRSVDVTPSRSLPTLSAAGLKDSELLATFLADLSNSPLLIPHLPEANLLNNLQEWVRRRVKGAIEPATHKKWTLKSQRRWVQLNKIDFTARANFIPFTHKQLSKMDWSHRKLVQSLFKMLLKDFKTRNKIAQLEQTQLYWPTMKYDPYASQSFKDTFFSYMPARMQDIFLMDPYSSDLTPKNAGKTCPLNI